jgi:hypothetical protein
MNKALPVFLLLAATALAQSDGANFRGSIDGQLFRDLSANRHGLFQAGSGQLRTYVKVPRTVPPLGTCSKCAIGLTGGPVRDGGALIVPKAPTTPAGTSGKCAIRLLEVPHKDVDSPMVLKQPSGPSLDPKIFAPLTVPACP